MSALIFKVMDQTRQKRKRIKCNGTVQDLVLEAQKMGFSGHRIMDHDGFEIEDDEDLRSNISHQLTILGSEEWYNEELSHKQPSSLMNPLPHDDKINIQEIYGMFPDKPSTSTAHTLEQLDDDVSASSSTNTNTTTRTTTSTTTSATINMSSSTAETFIMITEDAPTSSYDDQKFSNFVIPWNKLPSDLDLKLKSKLLLTGSELQVMANIFMKELQNINPRVPPKVIEKVAIEAAATYKESFYKKDEYGKYLVEKPVVFLAKMTAIRDYRNRKPNNPKHSSQTIQKTVKQAKENVKLASTVVNWQPNIIGKEPELEKLKEWLNSMFASDDKELMTEEIITAMTDTFGLQRLNINQNSNIEHTFAEWPFLTQVQYLAIHFRMLTGVELDNYEFYSKKYMGFLLPILQKSNNKAIKLVQEKQRTDPMDSDVRMMVLLAAYFKEDYGLLVKDFPLGTSLGELTSSIEQDTPVIAKVENSSGPIYYVFVDKERVASCASFCSAFSTMIAMYYVFNIMYPKKASLTLEFIQRQFLRIRTPVARGKKNSPTSMSAVFALMLQISQAMEDENENI